MVQNEATAVAPAAEPNRAVSRATEMATAALVSAMLAASAWIQIPLQPVPLTLQVFFVILAALLLSPLWAFAALGIYVVLGVAGAPVFAGGMGGVGVLAGPTGGYLLGFVAAATFGSLVRVSLLRMRASAVVVDSAAATVAIVAIYAAGSAQLAIVAHLSVGQALVAGVVPFVALDAAKAAVAVGVAGAVRRATRR